MSYASALGAAIRVEQLSWQYATKFDNTLEMLNNKLFYSKVISRGGFLADIPPYDNGSLWIINMIGEFFSGDSANLIMQGTDEEIADIIESISDDPESYSLYSGYALYKDGIWRPHGWVYNTEENEIIDSIPPKKIYYGIAVKDSDFDAITAMFINDNEEDDDEGQWRFSGEDTTRVISLLQRLLSLPAPDDLQTK